ncbi:MAG TPA: bis(5'-nucleosyl)-tetraphosphatase (symmetrical) YqeK [Clostridiales bacterium]|nr:bis(5'-nucleosyl)-tetraphosphatase (symmetrical) YqeK [Clostridiales bacterium]HPV02736.1 bis(5'-nucleosyl)-tetraphosphatase (symmetrical) YqeK [Clostridiales bacterium]
MLKLDEMAKKLQQMLTPNRFRHSVNTMETCIRLAEKYGADVDKAAIAGLIHDCAKDLDNDVILPMCEKYGIIVDEVSGSQPKLLHGEIGAHMAKELFGIDDPQILDAVADHTLGRPGMDVISSIVFIADYIEPGRDFEGVGDIRRAAEESLEKAIVIGINSTIRHVLKKGQLLHPRSVMTRNWALQKLKEKEQEQQP